jgi:hypothetical protein
MTTLFVHTDFIPGDQEGFGLWRSEHYYDHVALNLKARNLSSPVIVPEYDITSWDEAPYQRSLWLAGHYDMHLALRDATGITGVDLTQVNWDDPKELFSWLENHSAEHEILDQVLGV